MDSGLILKRNMAIILFISIRKRGICVTFQTPRLEDKQLLDQYLKKVPYRGCEFSFANVYLWAPHYRTKFAVIDDFLVFHSEGEEPSFGFPLGSGDRKKVIDQLMAMCEAEGVPFRMHGITSEMFEELEKLYPGKFEIKYVRDVADYIYAYEDLAYLKGKKLHGKRNHINRFMENNRWSYENISKENIPDCVEMAEQWRSVNGCEEDEEKSAEMCVVLNALKYFEQLELSGGLIRVEDKVVAFTIGEPVGQDTFVVHIEKAFADIQGAYPMINQQFVLNHLAGYRYINREEDMGVEGLRKAKLSYNPAILLEKGVVCLKESPVTEQNICCCQTEA